MAETTGIQWTQATWNPVTGCDRVSPGCAHCYALDLAARLKAMGNPRYQQDGQPFTSGPGFGVTLHPDLLTVPRLRWKQPRRIFVNSMSDLFHEEVPFDFVDQVFIEMLNARQHIFQILTKRPARMLAYFAERGDPDGARWQRLSPHIWLGVSVESQYWARRRVPPLLQAPAAVHFLSCEPLLSQVDLLDWIRDLQWVIVGGESGPKHRRMDPDWARLIRDQCRWHQVPFFFKQWGGRTPKAGGRELDGRIWDQYPHGATA